MRYLIDCPCGHTVDRHVSDGCLGDTRLRNCSCIRSPDAALDAAVACVRSNPERWKRLNEFTGQADERVATP